MKRILLFNMIVISIAILSAYSQNNKYYVIKVQGEILKAVDNQPLKSGITVQENDDFIFKSELSRAAVLNPEKGQFVLTPPDKNAVSGKAHFMPPIQNISSRAGGTLLNIVDFQNHFKDNFLIIEEVKVCIDPNNFSTDDNNFFFINYDYNGEAINKKLMSNNDTLIISKKDIFTIDGQSRKNPENIIFRLFYMKGEEANLMSEFMAILPDEEKLAEELLNIKQVLNNEDEFKKQAFSFVNEFYGHPQGEDLAEFIKRIK